MDIDDIFKRPPLPKGATNKRKFEMPAAPSVEESLAKVPKLSATTTTTTKARMEDVSDDEEDADGDGDDDSRAPEGDFAPNGDADYFEEEDEDGRFYGGGLSTVQKQVLNIMDHGKDDGLVDGEVTAQAVKKQVLALEKAINKNRDMRTRYGDAPEKFVDSEFALTESLHSLLLLSSNPALAYPILIELSTPASLADLLSHENVDIAIAVVEILEDWTDEEVLDVDDADVDEGLEEEAERRRDSMRRMVEALVEAGALELVVSGLDRLNEEDESERAGVFHTLGLLENLLALSPASIAPLILSPKSALVDTLFQRIGKDKLGPEFDQNRWYAAELLSVLLALPVDGVAEAKDRIAKSGYIDELLRVLSVYRRRDPTSSDETEFLENTFDLLCSTLSSPAAQAAFITGEGTELMCLMLKEKRLSRMKAVKTLDFALQGRGGRDACERFVESLGLKYLGAIFMGKTAGKKTKATATPEDLEHVLSILASLFTSLASESPARLRLLAKFVESDYEKVDRLVELREEIEERVHRPDDDEEDEADLDEDTRYIAKLGKGLFSLQLVDYLIAWLCMEDDGVRDHIKMLLDRRSQSLEDVMRVLIEYHDNIGDPSAMSSGTGGAQPQLGETEGDAERELTAEEEQREILSELLTYLQSLVEVDGGGGAPVDAT